MGEKSIILKGNNLKEIVESGLKKLNKSKEEVNIKILEEKKSLFGNNKYKIKMTIVNNNDSNKSIKSSSYYKIKYLDDGVYLSVYKRNKTINDDINVILKKIHNKKIEKFNEKEIKEIIKNKEGKFYKIAPPQQKQAIDEDVIIDTTKNNLKAYIVFTPCEGGKKLSNKEIIDIVKEKIKYGLNEEKLRKIINNREYNKKFLIATGKKSEKGKDSKLVYKFECDNEYKPEILDDGKVDYKNLNLINNVKKNDLLVEKIPYTKGENGRTVFGEIIQAKPGKDKTIKYGKNVYLSEDNTKLYASLDGQVALLDNKIVVHKIYEVPANIDNSTGNINFNGSVVVNGNVKTGFKIKATGDVIIYGVVEGAQIECKGNIIIKRGIHGHQKGELYSESNIDSKYIESCNIVANGDVKAEAIMHSNVKSENDIIVNSGKGLIVGGKCSAKNEIIAKTIGSTMETKTEIEVGIDPDLKLKYEELYKSINQTENNIDKLNKSIIILNKLLKKGNIAEDKKRKLVTMLKTRKSLDEKIKILKKEYLQIETQIKLMSEGKVRAKQVIYPGIKISICNEVLFVKEKINNCTIYKQNNEIRIGQYE